MASGCKAEKEEVIDWDAWTDALGSLALSHLGEQKLLILKLKHWMRSLDIFGFDHTTLGISSTIFYAALKENGDSTAESVTRNCTHSRML